MQTMNISDMERKKAQVKKIVNKEWQQRRKLELISLYITTASFILVVSFFIWIFANIELIKGMLQ